MVEVEVGYQEEVDGRGVDAVEIGEAVQAGVAGVDAAVEEDFLALELFVVCCCLCVRRSGFELGYSNYCKGEGPGRLARSCLLSLTSSR